MLHRVVREHLESFVAEAEEAGRPIPAFVELELRAYLKCGVLAWGFTRLYCDACRRSRLVAHSCGGRGFCPSCNGRRMAESAAHLVDLVLPRVPVRQYVLSLPFRLRFVVAFDHDLELEVGAVFVRTVFNWYRLRARRQGLTGPECGAVTVVQRFSGDLRINVHYHSLVVDGVFTRDGDAEPVFHELPAPTDDDIADLVQAMSRRIGRLLDKRGLGEPEAYTAVYAELCEEQPALALLGGASSAGRQALGRHPGQPVDRLRVPDKGKRRARRKGRLCARADGYDLHAATRIAAHQRTRLEKLCRYVSRGPVSNDRLTLLDDGRVALRLKRPFADGTSVILLDPLELLGRLAVLVPRPQCNGRIYYGVLAAHHGWRAAIVPSCRTPQGLGRTRKGRRLGWEQLLFRVLGVHGMTCDCGAPLRAVADIDDPDVVRAILSSMQLPTDPLPISPARPPPDDDALDWAA